MALSLEQYICEFLPARKLPWPAMPKVEPVRARPSGSRPSAPLKGVLWTVYGTLLAVPGAELAFEPHIDFMMDAALDKTIQEFKMWQSMSRKPGAPAAYMKELYNRALTALRLAGSGAEKYPELVSERIWDDIVKKLEQKEYTFDAAQYGSRDEFLKKLAYFFHASIQGCGAYDGAAETLEAFAQAGKVQGLLADGQSFTPGQLQKHLSEQRPGFELAEAIRPALRVLSAEKKARKPSETLFKSAVAAVAGVGLAPSDVLHVGSNLARDLGPAKKLGFRTALVAHDKASLAATAEQLKDAALRPDYLVTELRQLTELL